METGVVEIDVHGMTWHQAKIFIDSRINKAKKDTYVLRVVHGYHGGTKLKECIRKEYRNHPKVKRVEVGMNQGATDLILRELF